eukprot:TRINITY_DN25090_c0_g1_i1.p1 TRINITY_DN25090_c0_g1~~TRINITY_DN25090_c0_g1_i1.p1  ORF type:complete len:530 (+),score=37.98 TRINITY_DN25090_c0_g1_i1:108-1697(+)
MKLKIRDGVQLRRFAPASYAELADWLLDRFGPGCHISRRSDGHSIASDTDFTAVAATLADAATETVDAVLHRPAAGGAPAPIPTGAQAVPPVAPAPAPIFSTNTAAPCRVLVNPTVRYEEMLRELNRQGGDDDLSSSGGAAGPSVHSDSDSGVDNDDDDEAASHADSSASTSSDLSSISDKRLGPAMLSTVVAPLQASAALRLSSQQRAPGSVPPAAVPPDGDGWTKVVLGSRYPKRQSVPRYDVRISSDAVRRSREEADAWDGVSPLTRIPPAQPTPAKSTPAQPKAFPVRTKASPGQRLPARLTPEGTAAPVTPAAQPSPCSVLDGAMKLWMELMALREEVLWDALEGLSCLKMQCSTAPPSAQPAQEQRDDAAPPAIVFRGDWSTEHDTDSGEDSESSCGSTGSALSAAAPPACPRLSVQTLRLQEAEGGATKKRPASLPPSLRHGVRHVALPRRAATAASQLSSYDGESTVDSDSTCSDASSVGTPCRRCRHDPYNAWPALGGDGDEELWSDQRSFQEVVPHGHA